MYEALSFSDVWEKTSDVDVALEEGVVKSSSLDHDEKVFEDKLLKDETVEDDALNVDELEDSVSVSNKEDDGDKLESDANGKDALVPENELTAELGMSLEEEANPDEFE